MKRIITMTIALISAAVAQAQEQTSILADTLALDGSAVVAQKVLVKMEADKVTYKVEDDIDAKTSTVLDMLRKVPMVSVDAQDNITVNGSSSFQVYVDGMQNQMLSADPSQILKMMPATVVRHIEVITNPGAKYDAEGVGGVINLITGLQKEEGKALTEGQYGSVTLQGSTKSYGGGVFYSMQKGKWAFSLTGNASNTYVNGAESLIERTQKLPDGDFVTTTSGIADVQTPFYNGSFNLSYEIDSLNLITVGAGYTGTNLLTDSDFQIEMKSPLLEYAYGQWYHSKCGLSAFMGIEA
jgi:outer membrane cobalamin receptor